MRNYIQILKQVFTSNQNKKNFRFRHMLYLPIENPATFQCSRNKTSHCAIVCKK